MYSAIQRDRDVLQTFGLDRLAAGPSKAITLYELMQYIPVYILYELSGLFAASAADCRWAIRKEGASAGQTPVDEKTRESWLETFEKAKGCQEFLQALPFAMGTIDRLIEAMKKPETTLWEVGELLRDLERRIVDELRKQIHFQILPGLVPVIAKPTGGWETAIAKFPAIESDATEAGWCLACNRWTATVFHLMRVMEFGLDKLRRMVRVPLRSPGWDGVIVAVDRRLAPPTGARKKKGPAKRKRDRFIADAVMLLRAVKEARNTTMHDYTKAATANQAVELYTAVQSFMQKMAAVA